MDLPSIIRTTGEQSEAIDLLEEMRSENFKKNPNPKNANSSPFTSRLYSLLINEVNKLGGQEAVKAFLDKSLLEIKSLSKIKITLGAAPDEPILQSMETWLKKNSMQNYIFEIEVKPSLLGGAIIVGAKGDYKDYSLGKRIEEYFATFKQNG